MMMRALFVTSLLFVILGICTGSYGRTWYVNEEGTGDAPTIEAAMDSAAYGDTVLVGPGTYFCGVGMTDGVTLRSELGPLATILQNSIVVFLGVSGSVEGFTFTGSGFEAVVCSFARDFRITDNVITGHASDAIFCEVSWGEIARNTIVDNGNVGIFLDAMCEVSVHNNICVGNLAGIVLAESWGDVECNDCWGNSHLDFDGVPDPYAHGNFSEDPLFCDREGGDFTLDASSPCMPGNHPNGFECGLIGALGQGCDGSVTSVAEEDLTTWGMIKTLFR